MSARRGRRRRGFAPGRVGFVAAATVAVLLAVCAQSDAQPVTAAGAAGSAAAAGLVRSAATVPASGAATLPVVCHTAGAKMIEGDIDSTRAAAGPASPKAVSPAEAARRPRVVARHLHVPWGLAFLPGGGILVGQRDRGTILLVHSNGSKHVVKKVNGVVSNGAEGGEAGLLGLTLSPHFTHNHWVYAYLSAAHDNRVVRMRWRGNSLGHKRVIFSGIPRSLHHNGGRIAFGPDGMLYVTTGDAEVPARAQHRFVQGGKILRMTPRGAPAPGNPFHHSVVYSYGHRNVEGLAFDPSGRLWATEFGDHAYDELNLIRAGHNYGWPIVEGRSHDSKFTNPKTQWHTQNAGPSGIAIARRHGRTLAYIGALTGQRLWRVVLDRNRVVARKALFVNTYGRIRTTAIARGALWFTTSNTDGRATPRAGDDKLLRIPLR